MAKAKYHEGRDAKNKFEDAMKTIFRVPKRMKVAHIRASSRKASRVRKSAGDKG